MDACPVRPPMRMPAMLSTYAVPGELPASPAPSVAMESTIRPRRKLSGRPFSSVSPEAVATPMNVDNESNRSVNRMATIAGISDSRNAPRECEREKGRLKVGPTEERRGHVFS